MEIKTYYLYEPSTAAAGAVAGLFAVGCLATIFLSIRHKSWIWFVMVAAIASMYFHAMNCKSACKG